MSNYFVHESCYIEDNVTIGEGTKIWYYSHIQKNAILGENCTLGHYVNIANNVTIGSNVKIQNNVTIYEGVELEDYVFCGPSCVFTNDLKPRCKYPIDSSKYLKTLVKYGASLGANSTIVCGHTIGRHAMIASGAVVTNDVLDFALMAGVPAKKINWICECGTVLKNSLICQKCSREYIEVDGILTQNCALPVNIDSKKL